METFKNSITCSVTSATILIPVPIWSPLPLSPWIFFISYILSVRHDISGKEMIGFIVYIVVSPLLSFNLILNIQKSRYTCSSNRSHFRSRFVFFELVRQPSLLAVPVCFYCFLPSLPPLLSFCVLYQVLLLRYYISKHRWHCCSLIKSFYHFYTYISLINKKR